MLAKDVLFMAASLQAPNNGVIPNSKPHPTVDCSAVQMTIRHAAQTAISKRWSVAQLWLDLIGLPCLETTSIVNVAQVLDLSMEPSTHREAQRSFEPGAPTAEPCDPYRGCFEQGCPLEFTGDALPPSGKPGSVRIGWRGLAYPTRKTTARATRLVASAVRHADPEVPSPGAVLLARCTADLLSKTSLDATTPASQAATWLNAFSQLPPDSLRCGQGFYLPARFASPLQHHQGRHWLILRKGLRGSRGCKRWQPKCDGCLAHEGRQTTPSNA